MTSFVTGTFPFIPDRTSANTIREILQGWHPHQSAEWQAKIPGSPASRALITGQTSRGRRCLNLQLYRKEDPLLLQKIPANRLALAGNFPHKEHLS